jgi:hypothetical protein
METEQEGLRDLGVDKGGSYVVMGAKVVSAYS